MLTKKLLMAAAFGLAGLMAIPASAQDNDWHRNRGQSGWEDQDDRDRDHDGDRDRDHDRDRRNNGYYGNNGGYYGNGQYGNYGSDSQNRAYKTGYEDGVWDNQHGPQTRNRQWKNGADAQAYRDGYYAAYRGNGQYGRGDNGRWGDWGDNRGGNYGSNVGYGGYGRAQQGYLDGVNDGSADAQQGKGFEPTSHPGWRHADRGRDGSGMSKDDYARAYRQAYMSGYQRGFNNNSRGGYRR